MLIRFAGGALGVLSGTTSSRLSQNSVVIQGTLGHSIGVTEEPEGAIGYNHVWTVPGEETETVAILLAIYESQRTGRPIRLDQPAAVR